MVTKKEAQYVEQSKLQKCKDCSMFRKPDKCTLVEGEIYPNGHCKYWSKLPIENDDWD
jgi:hypothetical protein